MKLEQQSRQGRDPRALPQHRVLRSGRLRHRDRRRGSTSAPPPPSSTSPGGPAGRAAPGARGARPGRPPRGGQATPGATGAGRHGRRRQGRAGRRRRPPTRAARRDLDGRPRAVRSPGVGAHFVDWVRQQVDGIVGEARPPRRRAAHPHDPRHGRPARRRGGRGRGAHRPDRSRGGPGRGRRRPGPSGPWSGGRDFEQLEVDLALGPPVGARVARPGSTFKPFVLAAALEGGIVARTDASRRRRRSRSRPTAVRGPCRTTTARRLGIARPRTRPPPGRSTRCTRELVAKVGPSRVADVAQPRRHPSPSSSPCRRSCSAPARCRRSRWPPRI